MFLYSVLVVGGSDVSVVQSIVGVICVLELTSNKRYL